MNEMRKLIEAVERAQRSGPVSETTSDLIMRLTNRIAELERYLRDSRDWVAEVGGPDSVKELDDLLNKNEQKAFEDAGHSLVDVVGEDFVDDLAVYIHEGRDPLDPRILDSLTEYYRDQIPEGLSEEQLHDFVIDKVVEDYEEELLSIFIDHRKDDPSWRHDFLVRGLIP